MISYFLTSVDMDEGVRERKKRETRAVISAAATALFFERGFDGVTVDDVARAAKVSKMTVFNYFARKEDLLFDREAEGMELLRTVLEGRGKSGVLVALREEIDRRIAARYVFTRFEHDVLGFWKLVDDSPALRARLREVADEARTLLAAHFEGPNAELAAAVVVAGWRVGYRAALEEARRGRSAKKAVAELERVLDATMAAARAALRSGG